MRIRINSVGLELTPAIREYIEIKIGSLSRFLKKFESKGEVEVFVEIARTTKHHHQGDIFCAEASFSLGKKVFWVEDLDENIRMAIDKMKDKLRQEINKYKEMKIEKRRGK